MNNNDIKFVADFITDDPYVFNEMEPVGRNDDILPMGGRNTTSGKLDPSLQKRQLIQKQRQLLPPKRETERVMDPNTGKMASGTEEKYPEFAKLESSLVTNSYLAGVPQFAEWKRQINDRLYNTGQYSEAKAIQMLRAAIKATTNNLPPAESRIKKSAGSIITEGPIKDKMVPNIRDFGLDAEQDSDIINDTIKALKAARKEGMINNDQYANLVEHFREWFTAKMSNKLTPPFPSRDDQMQISDEDEDDENKDDYLDNDLKFTDS